MNKFGVHYAFWGNDWDVDLMERIRLAAELGFDSIDAVPPDYMVNLDYKKMAELKACAEDHGIDIVFCIGFPKSKDMASPDENVRNAGKEYSRSMIKAAEFMGADTLSGILYSCWPYLYTEEITPKMKSDAWSRAVDSVKEIVSFASDHGIKYVIEVVNRFEQFIVNSVEEGKLFIRDIGHPNAKLLIDIHHANIEENSIPDAIRSAGSLLAHMHISENNRRLPGTGNHIDWSAIAKAVKDINYEGRIVIESFLATGGPVGNDLRIWRNLESDVSKEARHRMLKESLAFVKKMFA